MSEPGDKVSKSFCILPWIHLNVNPNGNVYPCCVVHWEDNVGNVKDNTLEEIWNNDTMKQIRQHMLQGKKHKLCSKCYQQEDFGLISPRETANRNFQNHINEKSIQGTTNADGLNNDFKLIYWDFRFSNLCNFKCRSCSAALSSKWYDDEVALFDYATVDKALIHVNEYSKKNINYYLNEFVDDVEEIYFAGGEPLIMDEHYMILEKLIEIDNTDVRLRYNTNLSHLSFKKWDNLKLWENFTKHRQSNVDIYASLDGIGKYAEYARKGTKWNKIEENIKTCLENNVRFSVSCTVSIFNILHIPEFVDRLVELGVIFYHIGLYNILTFPHHYHINLLPENLKQLACSKLDEHLKSMPEDMRKDFAPKYESIKNYMYSTPDAPVSVSEKALKMYTTRLDKIRKESFKEVYPEYVDWINSIENV